MAQLLFNWYQVLFAAIRSENIFPFPNFLNFGTRRVINMNPKLVKEKPHIELNEFFP